MKNLASILVLLSLFTGSLFGQEKFSNQFQPKFTALFKDRSGAVVPGLKLVFKKGIALDVALTDINGKIDLRLLPGDYEITIENVVPSVFKAFLRIGGDNLLPNAPEFVIDTARVFPNDPSRPAILRSVDPLYPPYPVAVVRKYGHVAVKVRLGKDGKVISVHALNSQPLFLLAAATAARQFIFELSEKDPERVVDLSFVFLPLTRKDPDLIRYQNSYRILVSQELPYLP